MIWRLTRRSYCTTGWSNGPLDGSTMRKSTRTPIVWPLDKFNVTHTAFDVESVAAVCTRLRALVRELEAAYDNAAIVLVSHADVLQIAQLYAAEVPNVGYFSSYRFASKYHNTHSSTVLQCRRMIWSSCGGRSESSNAMIREQKAEPCPMGYTVWLTTNDAHNRFLSCFMIRNRRRSSTHGNW